MKISTKCRSNSWYAWQTRSFGDLSCFHWRYTDYAHENRCFSIDKGKGYPIFDTQASVMFLKEILGTNIRTYGG